MKYNKKTGRLFYKVVAAILLPTFLLSSFTMVFADSATSTPDTTQTSDTTTIDPAVATAPATSTDTDASTPPTSDVTPTPDQLVTSPATDPIDALKTDNSKIVTKALTPGAAPIQQTDEPQLTVGSKSKLIPAVDNTTGALVYSYPLTLPPGRNNFTPDLALQYNSQNTANDSVVGYGWNVSIPYIERENKHGVDQLYSGTYNDFTTSDKGELGQISGSNYMLRSDDGTFSKYVFTSNTWTVTTKTGMVYTYGTSAASRQDDASNTADVYKWMLDSVTDTNGNSISYSYYKDGGQIYPNVVTYTNSGGVSGPFTVTFGRTSAANAIDSGYVTGFDVTTNYVINTITVAVSGTTRHSYALVYALSDNSTRSLLSTITETGTDPLGVSKTFSPVTLSYNTSNGKTFTQSTMTMPTHTLTGGTRQDARLADSGDNASVWPGGKTGTMIDVNGDGYPDWIETENNDYATGSSTNGKFYDVWLGSSTGFTLSSAWSAALPTSSTGAQCQLSDAQNNRLIDINGDGLPDWIISTPGSTVNSDTSVVWLNTGTGWTKSTTWTMPTMTVSGTTYGVAVGPSTPVVNGVTINIAPSGYNYYTDLVDVNNDGLPDLVQTTSDNFGSSSTSDHYAVYLNTGTGWSKSTTWTMPVHPTGTGTYYGSVVDGSAGNVILDVNGDGLPDFVETYYSPTSNETYDVWLNSGTGWVRSTTWTLPVHTNTLPPNTFTSQGIPLGSSTIICNYGIGGAYNCATRTNALADVNGDGLPDFVETLTGSNPISEYDDVWLNNGKNGWVKDSAWTMPQYSGYGTPIRLGNEGVYSSQLSDVNNDGLLDFVASCDCGTTGTSYHPQQATVFINGGAGWNGSTWLEPLRSANYPHDGSILGFTDYTYGVSVPVTMHRTAILEDVNGDGSLDWVESNQYDTPTSLAPGADPNERHSVWTNSATQADLLSGITYDHGASSSFTYAPQTIVDKNATTQTQTVEALTSMTTNDGIGGTPMVTTYSYANGKYFYTTNNTWKKFAGFQKVTTTRPDGSKEIDYYHQGNGIDTSTYEFSDDEYQIGKLYRTDITNSAGTLFKRTTTEWTTFPITSVASNVAFVYPNQTITETFDGYATEKATAEVWTYDTGTGNLLTDTNYGQVTATTPLTFTDIGSDEQITTNTYATNGTGIYLLDDSIMTNQSLAKVWEQQYYYDSLALGSLTLGNQTQLSQWSGGSSYINTKKTYNSNGTVATSTDGRGFVTTNTAYDANNLYPITVTDPLSHVTHYTYDYMFGAVIQTTDPNSQVYITNLDGMGRVVAVQIPDPNTGTTTNRATYVYSDNSTGTSSRATHQYTDTGIAYYIQDYYDGLGRTVEEKRETDPNNVWYNYQTTDYWYGLNGQLSKQSLPYIDFAGAYDRGAGATTLNTSYTYDPMERVLTTTNNLGTTTNVYDDWKTTTTDPNGNVKNYYTDAYNNLSKVDEINSGTFTTTYTWSPMKLLTKITDSMGNVRTLGYSAMGNMVSAQDLHASADTSFGTWTYTYDADNDLIKSVSPNGATVNYTYDHDDRRLTEDYTGSTGTDITYTYDTCTQGVGRLCAVSMLAGTGANTAYTYDYDGNLASENKTINSNAFLTSYAYNRDGDIVTLTYPDSAVVQYNYLSDGLVGSVQEKESGGSFANVVSSIGYSPTLQISNLTYNNGDTTTNTFDATKLYRLTNKTSVSGGSNIQNSAYTYDADGNITNLVDSSVQDTSKTVAYTYDNLNRIKTATATGVATGTSPYAETYTYDALGNILTKNGQTYLYQGNSGTSMANPDAPTSINSIGFTTNYDNDGNMINNGTLTNTWNYKDQLTQTVNGSTTVNYYYDQNGNRVWYNVGTTNTYYPNQYYNYDGTTKTKQIYIGNNLIGTFQTASGTMTPWYIMTDNILGTSLATNASGAVKQVLDYYPFGDIRLNEQTGTLNEKNKFGGHQYDTETDLNYFGARYYSGKNGQFISEDPTFLAIGDNRRVQQNAKEDQTSLLMNPQALNSYAYANDNPITNIDPDGKIAGLDDAAGFFVGGLMGIGTTLVVNGKNTTLGDVGGSFITGGIIGWGAVNTPETLGASNAVSASLVTGLIGGFYGNVVKQGINIAKGNQKSGIDYSEAQKEGVITAGVSGILSGLFDSKIDGLSSGRNSMSAIGKTAQTKFLNGTIDSISPSIALKSAIGSQANDLYRTAISTGIDFIRSNYNKK